MKTTLSSKGQMVLPVGLRDQDGIESGREFEIERLVQSAYRLRATEPPENCGLVNLLLACPERDWFVGLESEPIDQMRELRPSAGHNLFVFALPRQPTGVPLACCWSG